MKTLRIAATVAALVAGPAAMAQIVTPANGPSDMFGIIFNSNSSSGGFNNAVLIDLGKNVGNFNFGSSQAFNLDSTFSQLTTDLGTSSASDLSFTVVAADNFISGSGVVGTPTGISSDFLAASAPTAGSITQGGVGNMATSLNTYLSGASSSFSAVGSPPPTFRLVANPTSGTSSLEWTGAGNPGATFWSTVATTAISVTGSPAQLYGEVNNYFSGKSAPNPTQTALGSGLWSVNFASNQLDYTVAAAVPVPPAVWLLLSGLVGVAAIGRRRGGLIGGMTA